MGKFVTVKFLEKSLILKPLYSDLVIRGGSRMFLMDYLVEIRNALFRY